MLATTYPKVNYCRGELMKLSIIVVAYNIENFVEQCLRSCIFEKATDYEVIVVHNASTDRTLDAIRRVTRERDEIFTIVENENNEGLGEGRNIGLRHARGEFVMFLDGDDWLSPKTFSRVYPILLTRNPDALMFDYVRTWDTGGTTENPNAHLLFERDISQPHERAKIIPSMGVAWNRIYKRSFIDKAGLKFNRRYYEDIDWNFAVILKASSYYVIPDRLVSYRQRSGSITKKVDPRHMDMLAQYRDVMEMFSLNRKCAKPYEREAYKYAKGQIFNVVASGGRLPHNLYRPFLKQASALLKEWRGRLGFTKLDTQLLSASTGFMPIFRLVTRYKKKVRQAKLPKLRQIAKLWLYRNLFLRLPIQNNKAVFESYWGRKIDCNPEAIAAGLAGTGNFKVVWGLDHPHQHQWSHDHVACQRNSLAYYYHLATAKYLVSNVNFADFVVKRRGTKHVQTFHGTPIKAMGIDIRPIRPKEMHWRSFAVKCRRWDVGISSNPYSTAIWRRSHPFGYQVEETGYPRNDALVNGSIDVAAVKRSLKVPAGKKVALYAPTFRDDDKGKPISVSKKLLDFAKIQRSLGKDYVLMVRAHHLSIIPDLPKGCIDASGHPSVNEVMAISDLLITDYSSLMFDYATQNRPIIIYGYDYEQYSKKRGFYMDIRKDAPGQVVYTLEQLTKSLSNRIYESSENTEKLKAFRAKFCPWDDGKATQRVLEQVFGAKPIRSDDRPPAAVFASINGESTQERFATV